MFAKVNHIWSLAHLFQGAACSFYGMSRQKPFQSLDNSRFAVNEYPVHQVIDGYQRDSNFGSDLFLRVSMTV
jgi:hypothetical protein